MTPEEAAELSGAKHDQPAKPKKTGEEWAKLFGPGVRFVGQVPNIGGPLGAYQLAHLYQQRMAERSAKLPGPPARTLKLGKPGWRPRSASAPGYFSCPRG